MLLAVVCHRQGIRLHHEKRTHGSSSGDEDQADLFGTPTRGHGTRR